MGSSWDPHICSLKQMKWARKAASWHPCSSVHPPGGLCLPARSQRLHGLPEQCFQLGTNVQTHELGGAVYMQMGCPAYSKPWWLLDVFSSALCLQNFWNNCELDISSYALLCSSNYYLYVCLSIGNLAQPGAWGQFNSPVSGDSASWWFPGAKIQQKQQPPFPYFPFASSSF